MAQIKFTTEKNIRKRLAKKYDNIYSRHRNEISLKPIDIAPEFKLKRKKDAQELTISQVFNSNPFVPKSTLNQVKQLLHRHTVSSPIPSNNRILVEGSLSFEKTILVNTIAKDWAIKKPYVSKYVLLFLIYIGQCKKADDKTGEDALIKIIKDQIPYAEEEDSTTLKKIIKDNEDKILLILDGYEDATEEVREILEPVLNSKMFQKMTVLVTSAPLYAKTGVIVWGLVCDITKIEMPKNQSDSTHPTGNSSRNSSGVNFPDKADHFFLRWSLYQVMPPYQQQTFKTRTELFQNIMTQMVKRLLVSERMMQSYDDLDLFNLSSSRQPPFVSCLFKFGKFALKKMKGKQFWNFTKKEILDSVEKDERIFRLGILQRSLYSSIHYESERDILYDPTHRCYLDFLAAYSLWADYKLPFEKISDAGFEAKIKDLVKELNPYLNVMFYAFLAGLTGYKSIPEIVKENLKDKTQIPEELTKLICNDINKELRT